MDKGAGQIRYNNELCKLMGEDTVRVIKAQRIQWLGRVERVDETAMPRRVLKGKLCTARRIERPRIRWLEDVITDLRRMGISGQMEKARNRDQWRRIVVEAKAHLGLLCQEEEEEEEEDLKAFTSLLTYEEAPKSNL